MRKKRVGKKTIISVISVKGTEKNQIYKTLNKYRKLMNYRNIIKLIFKRRMLK